MHQEREDLDIIFRKTTPESVLRELKEQKKGVLMITAGYCFTPGKIIFV